MSQTVKNLLHEIQKNEFDPGFITKKFGRYFLSTSGQTKSPETLNYSTKFRNNPVCQSKQWFVFRSMVGRVIFDIYVHYTSDNNFDIDFNFQKVGSFLKLAKPNKASGPKKINKNTDVLWEGNLTLKSYQTGAYTTHNCAPQKIPIRTSACNLFYIFCNYWAALFIQICGIRAVSVHLLLLVIDVYTTI